MNEFCKDCKYWQNGCVKGLTPRVSRASGLEVCNGRELRCIWEGMEGKHTDGKRY